MRACLMKRVLCCAALCCAVLCYAVLCCAVLQASGYILPHVQRALQAAAAKAPGWPVLICGHSLGGGGSQRPCKPLRTFGSCL